MKNKKIIIRLSLILILMLALTGCGSKSTNEMMYSSMADSVGDFSVMGSVATGSTNNFKNDYKEEYYEPEMPVEEESIETSDNNTNITENFLERKIVYSANIQTQTKNMDEAQKELYASIEKFEGYIENEQISNNGSIDSKYNRRYLDISLRIPSKNFNTFIEGLNGDNLYIRDLRKESTDYSESYYDKESRINNLKIQEERLLELLKNATNVETMLQIESRLSDIRYQIESLTKEMKFIDSRVDFSTINISIEEVVEYTQREDEPENFFEELIEQIKYSAEDFIDWSKGLLFVIIHLFPYLVIISIIILIIRKKIKKRKAKKQKEKEERENQNK